MAEPDVIIIENLDGTDPLLYAAKKAIGPKQLTGDEARDTARRAFRNNPGLASSEIGMAIGRSRRTVDSYVADLRAVVEMDLKLKLFHMNRLGTPQDRIAKRLGAAQASIHNHLLKMATLPNLINSDLSPLHMALLLFLATTSAALIICPPGQQSISPTCLPGSFCGRDCAGSIWEQDNVDTSFPRLNQQVPLVHCCGPWRPSLRDRRLPHLPLLSTHERAPLHEKRSCSVDSCNRPLRFPCKNSLC